MTWIALAVLIANFLLVIAIYYLVGQPAPVPVKEKETEEKVCQ